MIEYIKPISSSYDLAYYNQETILGGSSIGLSGYPSFNTPFEFGDAMVDAGFNLVSLATNHTLDRGINAIKLSREYWNKQTGVNAIGSYTSYEEKEALESKVYEIKNISEALSTLSSKSSKTTEPDHSLIKTLADRITFMEMTLYIKINSLQTKNYVKIIGIGLVGLTLKVVNILIKLLKLPMSL